MVIVNSILPPQMPTANLLAGFKPNYIEVIEKCAHHSNGMIQVMVEALPGPPPDYHSIFSLSAICHCSKWPHGTLNRLYPDKNPHFPSHDRFSYLAPIQRVPHSNHHSCLALQTTPPIPATLLGSTHSLRRAHS